MFKKLVSVLLMIAILMSASVWKKAYAENGTKENLTTTNIIQDKGNQAETAAIENKEKGSSDIILLSGKWEDYYGDIETFVYGLIINQLEYSFDVFPACVDLSDGNTVYGIAYTDYSSCYSNEDNSFCCFDAGFIPFNGELSVSTEEFDTGLYINNLEYIDDRTSFLWVYRSGEINQHCVVYDQYVKYGIDDNGSIFFENTDYVPGICDESLGSLYSFDKARYLLDVNIGAYVGITGVSLFDRLDFESLEKEINQIILTQNKNFATIDIVSCANFAREAVISYLLSLQEETFLGYNVPELVVAANTLDPMECYRITSEGLVVLNIDENTKANDVTKWLVGTSCVIVAAVAMVGSAVFIECPPMSALAGVAAGTAIDIFMQVVISERNLDNTNWRRVVLSAVTGAVSGFLGPYIYATCEGASYFVLDSAVDSLIGGIERATESWMDGSDAKNIISSFGTGVTLGFVLSAGFKGVAQGISKIAEKLSPEMKKMAEKYIPKLTQKVSAIKQSADKMIHEMKATVDASILHSQYLSAKIANKQLKKLTSRNADELLDESIDSLHTKDMFDVDDKMLSKEALKKVAIDAEDDTILGYFKKGDEIVQIVKKNSMVSIVFNPEKYQTIYIPDGLTSDRSVNFEKFAEILKKEWLDDSSLIPESIALAIRNRGIEIEELSPQSLVSVIQKSEWVIHENMDKLSATLVPRAIHQEIKHMGGVGLSKYLKSHMGKEFFDRFVSAAATGIAVFAH